MMILMSNQVRRGEHQPVDFYPSVNFWIFSCDPNVVQKGLLESSSGI